MYKNIRFYHLYKKVVIFGALCHSKVNDPSKFTARNSTERVIEGNTQITYPTYSKSPLTIGSSYIIACD